MWAMFSFDKTDQQFVEQFIEYSTSINIALKFSKSPKTFVKALAEHIFYHPDKNIQFNNNHFNNRGFKEWTTLSLKVNQLPIKVIKLYKITRRLD